MSSNRLQALQSLVREMRADFVNGWMPIAQTTLTGSVASVTFSSIPQNFRNLLLIGQSRTDRSAESDSILAQFNSDSGNNYDKSKIFIRGDGTPSANTALATTSATLFDCEAANADANNFSIGMALMIGYSMTDREKQSLCLSQQLGDASVNTDLRVTFSINRWSDTSAITSITLLPTVGPNIVSGSIFQLYGIL